ncbi:MAG: metalloregulator ArsR/SmtB family transcription factor [Alphaproteobacteria bacterium]|nr:metalloregulator ArsR/SmtB family transcription factor [Alphaproteobacteria bacterium]
MEPILTTLRAVAEPTRLRLLALAAHGELSVSEMMQIVGQSQPRVSRHLKLLVEARLLERHREGTWAFYRLSEAGDAAVLARTLIDLVPEDDPIAARDLDRLGQVKQVRAEAAAEYFRAIAADWHKVRALHVPEAAVERAMVELLDAKRPGGIGALIDIGTGTGRVLEVLGPHCQRAVGIDITHDMLAIARVNLEKAGLKHCQVRHGDMYNLSLPTGGFDLAIFHQVLHYADDPRAAIAEAARVLRPTGRLLIVDFAPHALESLRTEHQHRRLGFDDTEIETWLRAAGLRPVETKRLPGDPLTVNLWLAAR